MEHNNHGGVESFYWLFGSDGHHVFFDNFFTSVHLLEQLEEDGIYSCGTARKDRKGFPPALKSAGLKERYVSFFTNFSTPHFCTHVTLYK